MKETKGQAIKRLRKETGLTREELCQMIRLGGNSRAEDVQRLYKVENDKQELNDDVVETLAKLFDVEISEITKENDYRYNEDVFPEKLEQLLEDNDITRTAFADEIGVSRTTITNYITGKHLPSQENLEKILDYFDISIDYFRGEIEYSKNEENEGWMRIEEAAEELDVSKSTIYNRYKNGELVRKKGRADTGHQVYLYKKANIIDMKKEERGDICFDEKNINIIVKRINQIEENINETRRIIEEFVEENKEHKGFFKRIFNM